MRRGGGTGSGGGLGDLINDALRRAGRPEVARDSGT
jgi:hypothetical protein